MSLFVAHILNSNADLINVYEPLNDKSNVSNVTCIDELGSLDESDKLLVLIPSSTVTSYNFEENKSLSNEINIANFISETDLIFANEVSDNEYFLNNNVVYVVDKVFLKDLNTTLSELNCEIYVLPEYLINIINGRDVISEFEDRYIFTYSNRTGFATDQNSLEQYLEIVLNKNPNFNPLIFSSNKYLVDKFNVKPPHELFNLNNIDFSDINTLPNFFKIQISLNLFLNKMNLSKSHLAIGLISLLLLVAGPKYLIYENNINSKIYTSSTFDIFKSIDKDIKRVIAPKSQIDQILNQIPKSDLPSIKLPDLDIFFKYGSKYISDISIEIDASFVSIKINSMPDFQFDILKNNSDRFNITILDNDLITSDGYVNGIIKIEYGNE